MQVQYDAILIKYTLITRQKRTYLTQNKIVHCFQHVTCLLDYMCGNGQHSLSQVKRCFHSTGHYDLYLLDCNSCFQFFSYCGQSSLGHNFLILSLHQSHFGVILYSTTHCIGHLCRGHSDGTSLVQKSCHYSTIVIYELTI